MHTGWLPEFNCKKGECRFEVDPLGQRRLVTVAALGSHANWPNETGLFVYSKVQYARLAACNVPSRAGCGAPCGTWGRRGGYP